MYAPWNEINHDSQPTADAPARAAQYYNVVRAACRDCTVLAGDLLDQAGMTGYLARYRRQLDGKPAIWGLHNYADTNRFRSRGLRDMLAAVTGDVWLTETGGIVKFGRSFPRDEKRAGRAVTQAFKLARANPRVKRIYLYNWTAARPTDRFDSGLVGNDGRPRPGYEALRAGLGAAELHGLRPAAGLQARHEVAEVQLLEALADGLELCGAQLDERAALAAQLERLAQPGLAGVQALDDLLQARRGVLVAQRRGCGLRLGHHRP